MRTVFSLLLASGLAAIAAPAMGQATLKVGYVDSRRIMLEAPGAKEAQSTLEKEKAKYVAELKVLEDSLKGMYTEYEQKQVMLSPEAKKQRQDAIVQKQQAFQLRMNQLEDQAAKRQQELVEPIMDRINAVISDFRKAEGYAFIFDSAAGALVAADPALDLTEKVIAKLKATTTAAAPSKP